MFAGKQAAILYARKEFEPFAQTHFAVIREVTSCLMHPQGPSKSLESWIEWRRSALLNDLKEEFKQSFCSEMDKVRTWPFLKAGFATCDFPDRRE